MGEVPSTCFIIVFDFSPVSHLYFIHALYNYIGFIFYIRLVVDTTTQSLFILVCSFLHAIMTTYFNCGDYAGSEVTSILKAVFIFIPKMGLSKLMVT